MKGPVGHRDPYVSLLDFDRCNRVIESRRYFSRKTFTRALSSTNVLLLGVHKRNLVCNPSINWPFPFQ